MSAMRPCLCQKGRALSGKDAPDWMKRQLAGPHRLADAYTQLSGALHRVGRATSPQPTTLTPLQNRDPTLLDCA